MTGQYYEGGHWLGSFATYLITGRGLPPRPEEGKKGKPTVAEPEIPFAWVTGAGLEIWCGNQGPTFVQKSCAEIAGLGGVEPARLDQGWDQGRIGEAVER